MVTTSARVSVATLLIWALFVPLTVRAAQSTEVIPPLNTATDAIKKVFRQHRSLRLMLPLSDKPVYTSVRPSSSSAVRPLFGAFSERQQLNIKAFLRAVNSLVDARNRVARAIGIQEKWWWPTGINRLKVDAVLTEDLLTGRTDDPDEMLISVPKRLDEKLIITVQETYAEHGQDRILGQGHRMSIVTLIRQKHRWVIDEIKTTTSDAYGEMSTETLTERLQQAVTILDDVKHALENLPQKLEIKKGAKADN